LDIRITPLLHRWRWFVCTFYVSHTQNVPTSIVLIKYFCPNLPNPKSNSFENCKNNKIKNCRKRYLLCIHPIGVLNTLAKIHPGFYLISFKKKHQQRPCIQWSQNQIKWSVKSIVKWVVFNNQPGWTVMHWLKYLLSNLIQDVL